ncbi:MAG: hypothetical protein SV760_09360 [Halobacteria archaeon]|nr:hypothetical protein [Halobacteria archaeon]
MSTAAVKNTEGEVKAKSKVEEEKPEMSEKQSRIVGYLEEKVDEGKTYFKSKFMSDELNMSAKEIGSNMLKLSEKYEELSIEKWSYASATTWKVERADGS